MVYVPRTGSTGKYRLLKSGPAFHLAIRCQQLGNELSSNYLIYVRDTYLHIFIPLKKSAIILLVALMVLPSAALMLYKLLQCMVQHEMEQECKLPGNATDTLLLTSTEYAGSKINDREISYQGKMYDIKTVSIKGNKVALVAINDTKEESILKKIKALLPGADKKNSGLPLQLQKLISLTFVHPVEESTTVFSTIICRHNSRYTKDTHSSTRKVLSPPPQVS